MQYAYSNWSSLFLLPLGILALKCSHNGWSNGANLWWPFVLWPANRKWILFWHVPWGRVGFVFFFLGSRGWQSQQSFCHLLVSGTKSSTDCFVLCNVSHPKATALELNQKLQVKARMIHFLRVYFRGVSSNDFSALETLCKKIMKEKQVFERLEVKKETLLEMFKVRCSRRLFLASCSYSSNICNLATGRSIKLTFQGDMFL